MFKAGPRFRKWALNCHEATELDFGRKKNEDAADRSKLTRQEELVDSFGTWEQAPSSVAAFDSQCSLTTSTPSRRPRPSTPPLFTPPAPLPSLSHSTPTFTLDSKEDPLLLSKFDDVLLGFPCCCKNYNASEVTLERKEDEEFIFALTITEERAGGGGQELLVRC